MLTIDNLETQDDYTRELELVSRFGGRLVYVVANQSAVARFRPLVEIGGADTAEYGPEILLTPQSSFVDKISGARFRSAVAGSPARIVAQLSEPGDILPASGTPFTGTLQSGGGVVQPGAAALQQIATQLLGAAAASITFSAIPNTFLDLVLVLHARATSGAAAEELDMRFNADAGANYSFEVMSAANGLSAIAELDAANQARIGSINSGGSPANVYSGVSCEIFEYASATKPTSWWSKSQRRDSAAIQDIETVGGVRFGAVAALVELAIFAAAGNLDAGTRATLYGRGAP